MIKRTKYTDIIFIGFLLFLLRYFPIIPISAGSVSLDEAYSICTPILGSMINYYSGYCNWVKPLNIIIIVIAVGLIVHGVYNIYKRKK